MNCRNIVPIRLQFLLKRGEEELGGGEGKRRRERSCWGGKRREEAKGDLNLFFSLFLMTSSSVGVHRHLPHTFILLSLLRALSSSELSAGRIGFASLVLLWVRAGEGAYYIINPSNFTFRSSISSPLFSRFCFVFIRRR